MTIPGEPSQASLASGPGEAPQGEDGSAPHDTPGSAAALQAAEARYHTLFEHAQVGVLLADAQSTYLDANPSACRMLGYSRDELIGLHASDIVLPAEVTHIATALSEIGSQPRHQRHWRFRRKDGSVFLAEVIATRMPDGTLLGTFNDLSDRRRADETRERLAAIVESSHDGIISETLDGIITSWNAGAETIFGYSAGEMIGGTIERVIPSDKLRESRLIQEKLRRGERLPLINTQRRMKDGRLIDISMATSPINDADGQLTGASKNVRDITALKERERDLARISRLYAALSQINQAIVQTSDRDGLFRKICEALVEQGGFRFAWIGWHEPATHRLIPVMHVGEDDGLLRSVVIHTDDRPEGRGPSGRAFRFGKTVVNNDIQGDPSTRPWRGNYVQLGLFASAALPIRVGGKVEGTLNVYADTADFFHDKEVALLEEAAFDISFALDNHAREEARRAAERTVLSEKLFSDTMIDSMPGILYFYDAQGRFLRWNRNFETATGYSAAEIAGMSPLDFFSLEDKPLLQGKIEDVLTKGEASVEADLVRRDGSASPYFLTGRRIEFAGGPCLIGAGIDISERKRAEAEREHRHRAEAADRVKSAFLATMSHELRTPLNSIIGFTGILLQGLAGPLNPEQNKQLGMVRTSARHLLALVNDVLDISKIEAGQLEVERASFDLRQSITKVLAIVEPQAAAKHLTLRTELAPELGQAVSDQRRFEQILLNLLSNAIKFTEQGEVVLRAELSGGERPSIHLRVSDTGIGIQPEDLMDLFQPFRQIASGLSRSNEGTGLGLAICRRLAVLMGGEVRAESVWGEGSSFSVTLPIQGAPQP